MTSNGLGAAVQEQKGLFFVCLYSLPSKDGGSDVFIYKTPYPRQFLIEELQRFRTMSEQGRAGYEPGTKIQDKAYRIIHGLEEPSFSFSSEEFKHFSGSKTMDTISQEKESKLPLSDWSKDEVPEQIQFDYTLKDVPCSIHLLTSIPHWVED